MTIARRYLYETADAVRLEALVDGSVEARSASSSGRSVARSATTCSTSGRGSSGSPRRTASPAIASSPRSTTLGPDAGTVFTPLPDEAELLEAGILAEPMAALEASLASRHRRRRSPLSTCRARRRPAIRAAADRSRHRRVQRAVVGVHVGPPLRPGSDLVSESATQVGIARVRARAATASLEDRRPRGPRRGPRSRAAGPLDRRPRDRPSGRRARGPDPRRDPADVRRAARHWTSSATASPTGSPGSADRSRW